MPMSRSSKLRKYYEQAYRDLSRVELQRGLRPLDDLGLMDLFDYDPELWLGFYTKEGLSLALERYGMNKDLRKRGFKEIRLELNLEDSEEQMLRIWSERPKIEEPLLELVASRTVLHFRDDFLDATTPAFAPMLNIHWLLMQNPRSSFGPDRLPLPGQVHPGSGLGEQVMGLLTNTCRRLKLGGLVTVPAHFHNAIMYAGTYHYIDPQAEGALQALQRDLFNGKSPLDDPTHLVAASWAFQWKMIVDKKNDPEEPYEWFHEAMVHPCNSEMRAYFESPKYLDEVAAARDTHDFKIFDKALSRQMARCGLAPWDSARVNEWLAKQA
ncbi:hypothetical protein DN745_13700 [Bradymonas sediminis]|uniref:Uncharacterized protein n=2 Tax=Bradymonas sediminis TaxID=1548548 RepID=A0A2Z4FNG9_9DELT|nr:hypothetical protein DN745_13700 [Bradymonas sediminis]